MHESLQMQHYSSNVPKNDRMQPDLYTPLIIHIFESQHEKIIIAVFSRQFSVFDEKANLFNNNDDPLQQQQNKNHIFFLVWFAVFFIPNYICWLQLVAI